MSLEEKKLYNEKEAKRKSDSRKAAKIKDSSSKNLNIPIESNSIFME
jgi:hypothetical protein